MKKFALGLVLGLSTVAAQAASYAVVDIETVLKNSTYVTQQRAALEQNLKPQTTQINELQKELAALQQKANTSTKLSDAEKQKISAEFDSKVQRLTKLEQETQAKAQAFMQTTNNTIETRVKTAAEQLRQENKLDIVLNKNAAFAYDPKADLTDKMIQKINAMK